MTTETSQRRARVSVLGATSGNHESQIEEGKLEEREEANSGRQAAAPESAGGG